LAAVHYQHAATTLVQPLGSLAAKKPCTSSHQYPHGLIPHLDRLLTESCLSVPELNGRAIYRGRTGSSVRNALIPSGVAVSRSGK
jgi:hypothetical protein